MTTAPHLDAAERAVLDHIDVSALEDLAVELVRARGENPPGGEGPTAAVLAEACRDRGLAVRTSEVAPGRPNVSAVLDGGPGPGLLLLGHTDVVPVGLGWSVDPFAGLVRDGRLVGRGAADMKGGLAACVAAMTALREAGAPLGGPVELAAVVDEEETGEGVRAYLREEDRSGFAGCVVAEPTDLRCVAAARGDAYVEIEVGGRAAHSGSPDDGLNAVYAAAEVVAELQRLHAELAAEAHPLVGPPTWSVGQIAGGVATSTVPARCLVTADRRLAPGEQAADVLAALRDRLATLGLAERGYTLDVRLTMDMPGFETPVDSALVTGVDAALAAVGGPGLPVGGWSAACDGGFVARDAGVPVVVMGPGSVATQAHRPDESVALADLVLAARAYACAALRLLSPRRLRPDG